MGAPSQALQDESGDRREKANALASRRFRTSGCLVDKCVSAASGTYHLSREHENMTLSHAYRLSCASIAFNASRRCHGNTYHSKH